jgi:hypothetical protein
LAANTTFSCATTQQKNSTFEGSCKPSGTNASTPGAGAEFSFDSRLNILKFSEHRDCDGKYVTPEPLRP